MSMAFQFVTNDENLLGLAFPKEGLVSDDD
jgi:hypothetical protein